MSTRPPNIVLTIADDQRGSALGMLGVEPVHTPCLDELASRGVCCDRAFHFGSCHGAVCAPSRAMLHTGRPYTELDPAILGPTDPPADRPLSFPTTLGRKLRDAGYHTFATGKWHNGTATFHASFDHGDAIFFGGMADHWFTPVRPFDPAGRYPFSSARTADGFSSEVFADAAVRYLHSRAGDDRPFFCYVAFTAPHDPRTPPDEFRRMYDPRKIQLPANHLPEPAFDNGELNIRDERLLGHPRNRDDVQRSIAEYYGMISHMDRCIGRIHQAVDAIGARRNTLILHTADHGLAVGQHGLLGKQNLYEHSIRVPLILAGPGLPGGRVNHGLCYQHDLHPTILRAAGLDTAGVFFEDLGPMLRGERDGRSEVRSAYMDKQRCLREGRFKLIEYTVQGQRRVQLFDLDADPWERFDLSTDPAQAERLLGLESALTPRA